MFNLNNKKFLVTGASGGIGSAIVRNLYDSGATLCISGTRMEVLEEIKNKISPDINIITCNLANKDDVKQLVPKAAATMNGFDGIICNAGITKDSLIFRMKEENWDDVININLKATFLLNQAACTLLLKNKWGRIINISSVIAIKGNPGQANYAASKAGMIGMSKSIAYEVAKKNITVNCIAPGFIATPMTESISEQHKNAILAQIPQNKYGQPQDISAAVVYLVSEEANYITGQTLHINGGMLMP